MVFFGPSAPDEGYMGETVRVYEEEYGASLSTLRMLGAAAARGTVEAAPERQLAYDDFRSSIEEMLKTDPEFRGSLDVDAKRTFQYYDGHVVVADGTPMVAVIERGMQNAFKAAQKDPRMWAQYARDKADRDNAIKVDRLLPGQSLVALSMDPKHELGSDSKFWQDRGYREGIAYLQWYSKQADGSVVAGSASVDMSDETSWRSLFTQLGYDVPASITPNEWLAQSITLQTSPQQTEQFIARLRNQYYQFRGAQRQRFSVTEYVQAHEGLLRQQFDLYYPALARAIQTGKANSAITSFATSLLRYANTLDPAKRRQLTWLVSTDSVDEATGRMLDGALRYAVVEDLRRGLGTYTAGNASVMQAPVIIAGMPYAQQYELMNERLATNVKSGAAAGRSYGGCAGQFNANAENAANDSADKADPQSAFGGRDGTAAITTAESSSEVCVYEHNGCYCCGYNSDGSARLEKMKVKAYRNKQGVASCLRPGCGAWLPAKGKGDEGNIWRKAQALLKAEQAP